MPQTRLPFTLDDQLPWADLIGRRVSKHYGFQRDSQELDDLRSTATFKLIELYRRPARGTFDAGRGKFINRGFNPSKVPPGGSAEGLFRGWAYAWIVSECVRAAKRLRNGGTYNTTRPENEPRAVMVLGDEAEWIEATPAEDCQEISHSPDRRSGRLPVTLDDLGATAYGRRLACGRTRAT